MMRFLAILFCAMFALPVYAANLDDLRAFNLVHNSCKFEQNDLEACYENQLAIGLRVDLKKMIPHLQTICDGDTPDNALACYYAGRAIAIYQPEDPVSIDGLAMRNYNRACENGVKLGCTYAYQRQTLIPDNKLTIQGQIKLQETCYKGENRACRMLGAGLSNERWESVFNLKSMGASYNQECSNQGNIFACSILAFDEKPGFGREEAAKIQLSFMERSCQSGITENCILLGDLYREGNEFIAVDLGVAAQSYERGCESDKSELMPKACALYADTLLKADDSEASLEKAQPAYVRACLNGYTEYCFVFGSQIKPDAERFETECNASNGPGCLAWGMVLYEGKWQERDLDLAFEKVQASCSLEEPLACAAFADYLLEPEEPIEGSAKLAVEYRERACLYGDAISCQLLEDGVDFFVL